MYGDDGPEDDYMTTDQALDAGWFTPDDTDEIREILCRFDFTIPQPGTPRSPRWCCSTIR